MTTFDLAGVTKTYPGAQPVEALRGVDLRIGPGEFLAVEGPSGSGKSTLLNILALLDAQTSGTYRLDGRDVASLGERERARLRGETFGFVFQGFHLMDHRTVVDNVELGMLYAGVPADERRLRALEALDRVGLSETAHRRASDLSGGQRQRVAIARALSVGSGTIVADEPTGNLDTATSESVLELLTDLHRTGTTVVLVTHSPEIAARAQRRLVVRDGLVVTDTGGVGAGAAEGVGTATTAVAGLDLLLAGPSPEATGPAGGEDRRRARHRVGFRTVVRDAAASVASRRGRTATLAASVAVGVALALTTVGLSASAQAQVSERFDARLNRAVTLTMPLAAAEAGLPVVVDGTAPGVPGEAVARLADLPGVDAAALVSRNGMMTVALPGEAASVPDAFLLGVGDGIDHAAELGVDWAGGTPGPLGDGEVLLGRAIADRLGLGPLSARPQVVLDGRSFVVRGIVDQGYRVTNVIQAVLVPVDVAAALRPAAEHEVYVFTATGAAQQVAAQAPLVLRPSTPEAFTIVAPPDPRGLRGEIENDVRTILLVLTGVAILASVVSLTSAMTMSVLERSREIGMRRAIGAQARHVSRLVMTEAALVGVVGGVAGAATGVAALLAITIARRWTPVLDLGHVPVAVAGGVVVGVLGGVAASLRARRIQPSEALRV
ncbi:ABC transporter ATP-binding protein/permease [Cellulosimicrobium sp. ES-005]|uniref:ABC transporter ATP-binding protein/permease n=1 Tax=Cellulosimicrobium sp. ES-005 TaxID=3163031 RepID=A0AAU8G128_9MICO